MPSNFSAAETNSDPNSSKHSESLALKYATFSLAGRLYGIDVTRVQEVVRPMQLTRVPLAPPYIRGLINLRGQVATAIGMRELLGLPPKPSEELMNVVCRIENTLLSFLVDEIGDVLEVDRQQFESTPATVHESIRKFLAGVFKANQVLLSVIDIEPLGRHIGLAAKHRGQE